MSKESIREEEVEKMQDLRRLPIERKKTSPPPNKQPSSKTKNPSAKCTDKPPMIGKRRLRNRISPVRGTGAPKTSSNSSSSNKTRKVKEGPRPLWVSRAKNLLLIRKIATYLLLWQICDEFLK